MRRKTDNTSSRHRPPIRTFPLPILPIGAVLILLFLFFSFPCTTHAASNYELEPGSRTDVSDYKKATNLYLNKSGTYTLTGTSSCVLVHVGKNGGNITLKLDKLNLEPNNSAPGASGVRRSAITIYDVEDASIAIFVNEGTTSSLKGWKTAPALSKTGLKTSLTFVGGGTLYATADPGAFRTAAIGSAENESLGKDVSFGNVTFDKIKIIATGSGTSPGLTYSRGGPGIGASFSGYVDGIVFNEGCDIKATAGAADSAAIGTASGDWSWHPIIAALLVAGDNPVELDYPCKNLTINGGTIEMDYLSDNKAGGGAGLGGGRACSISNIIINGGSISVLGKSNSPDSNSWSTGIGAGANESANNITITGGTIKARGMSTGIGGGQFNATSGDRFIRGDCYVYIEGGKITAISSHGVGIGGWAGYLPLVKKSGCGVVSISGGDVTATGGIDGCGIGAGGSGYLSAVNISGGKVVASTKAKNTGKTRYCAIGARQESSDPGKIRQINITGGTVAALNSNDKIDRIVADELYINGGSVYADADKVYAYKDGPEVKRNGISLYTSVFDVDWSNNSLDSMTTTSLGYEYGTKDIIPFKGVNKSWEDFYFWLPEDAAVQSATLKQSILQPKVDEFTGKAGLSTGDKWLYPPIEARLHEDQTGGTVKKAKLRYLSSGIRITDPPTKPGYTLRGFSITPGGDKVMESDGTFLKIPDYTSSESPYIWNKFSDMLYEDGVDFYGLWEEIEYTFVFRPNRPATASTTVQGSVPEKKLKRTEAMELTNSYTLPGYDFDGWNTRADGTGTGYMQGDTLSPETAQQNLEKDTLTLYAQWKPKTYELTFEKGSEGTGTSYRQTLTFDKAENLALNRFTTSENRVFAGWKRKVGSGSVMGGHRYEDGVKVCNLCNNPANADPTEPLHGYTLEAQWTDTVNFTVVLLHNDNFKQLANAKQLKLKDANDTTYTPFVWDAASERYSCLETDVPAGEYTLTVDGIDEKGVSVNPVKDDVVSLRYYSVEIEADGDASAWLESAGTSQKEYVRADSTISIGASANRGHRFIEYTATGTQPTWQGNDTSLPEQKVTIHGKTLITAHADAVEYQVRFLPNSDAASGSMPLQDMRYGEPQALFDNQFVRRGYKMTGWTTEKDGGKTYEPGQRLSNLTDKDGAVVNLYAVWQPITYTLCFDGNDAQGSMDDITCSYGKSVSLPINRFSIPGYEFQCWNTEADNTGHAFRDGASCRNLTDQDGEKVTLYAQWAYIGFGPWILIQPENLTVTKGGTAEFKVLAYGMDPLTYQWQRRNDTGWQDIEGASESTLKLQDVTLADNGMRFRVRVTNGDGNVIFSNLAKLTVKTGGSDDPHKKKPDSRGNTSPETGDTASPGIYGLLMALSVLSLLIVVRRRTAG